MVNQETLLRLILDMVLFVDEKLYTSKFEPDTTRDLDKIIYNMAKILHEIEKESPHFFSKGILCKIYRVWALAGEAIMNTPKEEE